MRRLISLIRPAPFFLALALLVHDGLPENAGPRGDRSEDLAAALRAVGLTVKARDVGWVDPPPGAFRSRVEQARAFVLARRGESRADVWLVRTRLSPEGRLLHVYGAYDLTSTSAVDERSLVVSGQRAGWLSGSGATVYRVELADLEGEPPSDEEVLDEVARAQQAITNLQKTGQGSGILRRTFKLDPAGKSVELTLSDRGLAVVADGHAIRIPYARGTPIVGERFIREQDRFRAPPGNLVTWAVDRVRESAWFGDENMQLVKALAFAALDRTARAWGAVTPDTQAAEIAEETEAWTDQPALPKSSEIGWPPPPLAPLLNPSIEREGTWNALSDEAFFLKNEGSPPPFVTTFIRTDGERPQSRIFVAAWDPRQVDLHMMPGTEEPISATGETGTGIIPRDPRMLERLLAAFNGGFQSTHGDFGMMVDHDVLVPPKPYAATVAVLEDGSLGFGTWPHDVTIGAELVSFRQNLTPLVIDDTLNPYRRSWWGGVPQDWEDETRTVRSGLCLTQEGFVAYFYGAMVDYEHLGRAMRAARCAYGLHLDMNQGHTGLEFYRVAKDAELPPIGRALDTVWEAEDAVSRLPGYRFRSRRLIKNMQLMHFPRYIRRGQRDFFFLTLRSTLPGSPIPAGPGGDPGEGTFSADALPQQDWPHAVALTSVRPDPQRPEAKVHVVKIDPKLVEATGDPKHPAGTVVSLAPEAPALADIALFHGSRSFALATAPPASGFTLLARLSTTRMPGAVAAVGVAEDGMLVYAEVATAFDPARDASLLASVLASARCEKKAFSTVSLALAVGGNRDLAGHPMTAERPSVRLVRTRAAGAQRIFPQTPVLSPAEWQPLQQQTRFFDSQDGGAPTQ